MLTPPSRLRAAESALLARRREQRGAPTLGDDVDRALLAAVAALPADAAPAAREVGHTLGAEVYSRRFFEDTLPGAIIVLSTSLHASGAGALHLADAFHRSARVRFEPLPALEADASVVQRFTEGALEGFLSAAFNCRVRAAAESGLTFRVELGEGRDVNVKGASA